jgi:uncharacterized RDD family membrane protein YckC
VIKFNKNSKDKNDQHASLNRRLLASMIDLLLVILVINPFITFVNKFVLLLSGGVDMQLAITDYSMSAENDSINIADLYNYLKDKNAILPWAISQLCSFMLVMTYCITFWIYKGATIGKMLLRIKVQDIHGGKITKTQAVKRMLGYYMSAIPLCIGFIMINFRKDKRGLHDLFADTAVVIDELKP